MKQHFISRRFLRIKALQHLYAYTICQQVYKKQMIEHIKQDFAFDIFFDEPSKKSQLEKQEQQAIAYCLNMIENKLHYISFKDCDNSKVAASIQKNFTQYKKNLLQEQQYLQSKFHQSKAYIYKDYLYILWLFIECHKLALQSSKTVQSNPNIPLEMALVHNLILKTLHQNTNWLDSIIKKYNSWPIDIFLLKREYLTLITSCSNTQAIPHPKQDISILEYLFQGLVINNKSINDFLIMQDPYWHEHKHLVKRLLIYTAQCILKADFLEFKSFFDNLENEWEGVELFYNLLLKTTIKHNDDYEAMISTQAIKWDSSRLVLIDKIIIKLALGEILYLKEAPIKVAMNEYIEIAKRYGTPKSSQFINGILDGILKNLNIKS